MYFTRIVCLAAVLSAIFLRSMPVQADIIIYQDAFSRSGDLNGSAPDTTLGMYGGTSGATWLSLGMSTDGSQLNTSSASVNTAFLPFTPQSGNIYTLTANMNSTNKFVGIGFSKSNSTTVTPQFYYPPNSPVAWIATYLSAGEIAAFEGPGASAAQQDIGVYNGPTTLVQIVLDTTGADWTATMSAPGSISPNPYTTVYTGGISDIQYVMIGANSTAWVDNFSLAVSQIPEPDALVLAVFSMFGPLVGSWRKWK